MDIRKKILVVEDDKTLLEALSFKLKNEGYHVETAEDGWKALDVVDKGTVDLIISDIMMPSISGLSLLSVLNEFYLGKIPVIVISSLDKANVIISASGLGASDFIIKPINYQELLDRIKRLLYKKKQNHSRVSQNMSNPKIPKS
jgi:DNA-binding response OmpR family regulator